MSELEQLLARLRSRAVTKRQAYDAKGNKLPFALYEDDYVKEVPADQDCADALAVIEAMCAALAPLVRIADAYDANELDDEARKRWGRELEHENSTPPDDIELYSGRGGQRLLTLADALAARSAVRGKDENQVG